MSLLKRIEKSQAQGEPLRLSGKRVAVLVEEGFGDLEFWVPVMRLLEEGAMVTVVGTAAEKTVRGQSGLSATGEVAAESVSAGDFEAILVPGGWAPDRLRRDPAIIELVRKMYNQDKIVGFIGHAGLVGISAGIVREHKATGSPGIKDDLINAGATWVERAAVRDRNIVWGRDVEDIPAFCRELIKAIEVG